MSEEKKPRIKEEAFVSCKSCGKTSKTFVLRAGDGNGLVPCATCPKCSNKAYVNNLNGLWIFMQEACAELAAIKGDIGDLQHAAEGGDE